MYEASDAFGSWPTWIATPPRRAPVGERIVDLNSAYATWLAGEQEVDYAKAGLDGLLELFVR